MKKYLCLLMSLIMTLSLIGCGTSKEDDPNAGLYEAKSAEMMGIEIGVEEAFDGGFTMELKSNGKGTLNYGDESANFKWTLDGEVFEAKGGGAELEGTLKDGKMVLTNVLDSGVTLTLINDDIYSDSDGGDGDDGGSKAVGTLKGGVDNADSSLFSESDMTTAEANNWDLYMVEQNGQTYTEDELKSKGVEAWIKMNADGTGSMNLIGKIYDMTWTDGVITIPSNDDGEEEEFTYTTANEYLVLVQDDMVLTFIKQDSAAGESSDDTDETEDRDMGSEEISYDLMQRYEGDWHGLMYFTNGTGRWKERDGKKCDVVARFALDDKGNVTPYMAAAMKEDPDTHNFRDLEVELDPFFDTMYVTGMFLDDGEFELEAASSEDGFFHMMFTVECPKDGSSIDVEIGMRRPDDPWQDDDYPHYSQEGFDYYKGCSLEQVIDTFGNPPSGLPKQTHVTEWER